MNTPTLLTEEKEAEFWDIHSPLDFFKDPKPEALVIFNQCTTPKTKSLTIRIGDGTYDKLQELAKQQGIGTSTLVRFILMSFPREEHDG